MAMAGTAAEYEKMALAALEKARSGDPRFHNARAQVFATLAAAAAAGESPGDRAAP